MNSEKNDTQIHYNNLVPGRTRYEYNPRLQQTAAVISVQTIPFYFRHSS